MSGGIFVARAPPGALFVGAARPHTPRLPPLHWGLAPDECASTYEQLTTANDPTMDSIGE